MRESKAKGICLRATDVGDSDKLCNIYLLGQGKRTVKFKSVKKAKTKLAFAASPLCLGEYMLLERNGYFTCVGCDLINSFMPIWGDLDKYYCALSAIELLDRFSSDNQDADDIAIMVIDYITRLSNSKYQLSEYLVFLYRFFVVAGYGITVHKCAVCGEMLGNNSYYSYSMSGFICPNCKAENLVMSSEVYNIFVNLTQSGSLDSSRNYRDCDCYFAVEIMLGQILTSCDVRLIAGTECLNNIKLAINK